MMYHVIKASRMYGGKAYNGPTMRKAGYTSCEFNTISEAIRCAEKLSRLNPIGFEVYISSSGNRIWTYLNMCEDEE